ncbi:MAG TPA: hypothetical protein VF169_00260 [Albitalea sp.]|uniref:hypothetical protein n=1 Tax=Piscinibacter sp. TaxID=1903157 RepID=UPI002ED2E7BF
MTTLLRITPLALALSAVVAQAAPPENPLGLIAEAVEPLVGARVLIGEEDTLAFSAFELGRERIVKGAPYCADAELESVQPLADGNRIVKRQTTRLCRDGEGRTRQDIERGGRRIVYLSDPVAGESWALDPERKTARRLPPPGMPMGFGQIDHSAWRDYAERMRDWARSFRDRMRREPGVASVSPGPTAVPAPPPLPVIVAEDEHEPREAGGRRELQVQVLRLDPHAMPLPAPGLMAPLPPGVAMRAQLGAPRGPGVATSLGSKEIEGVKVNGERTTWTIEAGKLGNEKPIVITREVWTSPELMLTVQSRDADPRVGETTYRLARLKRGEPDAALMKVPADYAAPPKVTGKG